MWWNVCMPVRRGGGAMEDLAVYLVSSERIRVSRMNSDNNSNAFCCSCLASRGCVSGRDSDPSPPQKKNNVYIDLTFVRRVLSLAGSGCANLTPNERHHHLRFGLADSPSPLRRLLAFTFIQTCNPRASFLLLTFFFPSTAA